MAGLDQAQLAADLAACERLLRVLLFRVQRIEASLPQIVGYRLDVVSVSHKPPARHGGD
jgi:hypothetical protein